MPFLDETAPELTAPRVPEGVAPPKALDPSIVETFGAAFRAGNPVVNTYRTLMEETFPPQPGYNPMTEIRGTDYEALHAKSFTMSQSPSETSQIKAQIDGEEEDRRIRAASGFAGFVADVVAGSVDPTMALPAGVVVRSVKGGYATARSAASVGVAAAAQTAIQEGALQLSQQTRTAGESAGAVASSAILGGLIGAGAARLLSSVEYKALESLLDKDRAAIDTHAMGQTMPAPAGAAASDARQLEMFRTPVDFTAPVSVTRRVMGAEATEARRIMADLAEMPYRFRENEEAVATTQGPALDRLARMQINGLRVQVADDLDRLFSDYRFGQPDKTIPRLRARVEDVTGTGEGKLSYHDFKREVSVALQNGDQHDLPQVAEAAQSVRRRIFDPWKKRAQEAGLLPEDVDAAESYFPHMWNKEIIRARRPEFTNKLVDLFTQDQTTKRGIQERLGLYRGALDVADEQIGKITARVKALEEDVEVVQARQEEATRLNKFATQRATDLRESQYFNDGGVRKEAPGKNIEKARGGAVFETNVRNRGNDLADRASGKLAQIEELELKFQTEIANAESMRAKIEAEISTWDGKSATEAKAALKAREKADAARTAEQKAAKPRLGGADDAIDRTVRRILESDRNIDIGELRARAQQTVDRILGSPDGRLPYDMHMGGPRIGAQEGPPPRGALAERALKVSNAWAKDWIENDIEHVTAMHLRTMVPDVLLTERFGDVEMSEGFRKINETYAKLSDTTKSEKERIRLGKERDAVIRDVAAVRDRVRGVYGWAPELANMARVANAAKVVNNLTSMGSAALSSLPDMAGVVFRYGLTGALRDGWAPFFKGMVGGTEEWGKFKTQMRAIGIGIETATNARQHSLDDVVDTYRPQSRVERMLQGASDKFFIANLLAPLTDAQKLVASHAAVSEILRASKFAVDGSATKRQIGNLAESGIDMQMAARIWRQFGELKRGEVIDGVHLPNTQDWTDRAAADALNGAVAREVDIAVVTPGQEKPLWMSKPVISLLGQFKAFTAASTERILIANLQRRDASALSGLVFSVGLGMMTYKLNAFFGGTKTSDRPQDWVKEGISRGGLLGWFEEGNALASKATRGSADVYRLIGADKPLGRFASRSAADMLLGPTWGKIESLPKITGAATSGEWSASDSTAVRRLIAGQNLWYLRGLLNKVEESANNAIGVEPKPAK